MPRLLLFVVIAAAVAAATAIDREEPPADYTYASYLHDFAEVKAASGDASLLTKGENVNREAIFQGNLERIRAQNRLQGSWRAGLNEFTDWTVEEFKARRTGTLAPEVMRSFSGVAPEATGDMAALPDAVDWRTNGSVVTAPKNQGGCGSCWAFSATETLESAVAIATGKSFELSPQQIVSCSPNPLDCGGTGGCDGSTQQLAFNYTMTAGITTDKSYPYAGTTGTCKPGSIKPVAGNTGYVTVPQNNYTELARAVATVGPVAITVAAGGFGWQLYSSGVYSGGLFGCGFALDHGVQLVGYGEDGGKLYWWVRNSWGASWGEHGYMRLRRFGEGKEPCGVDKNPGDGIACKGNTTQATYCGECGILSSSSYPTGAYLK